MQERQIHHSTPTSDNAPLQIGHGSDQFGIEGSGRVQVIFGAVMDDLEVAGMSVGEARNLLNVPYNIAPNAFVTLNGFEADDDTRLAEGDVLEFVRPAGEKGVA
jgi:hypothetical protein